MEKSDISVLSDRLKIKQDKFRYFQRYQENIKRTHDFYDPYDCPNLDRHQWEMKCQAEMSQNKYVLKALQHEIIELRSEIKKLQRKQNNKKQKQL